MHKKSKSKNIHLTITNSNLTANFSSFRCPSKPIIPASNFTSLKNETLFFHNIR